MVPISIDKFTRKVLESNDNLDGKEFKRVLKNALERKKSGVKCINCGCPIWAIGPTICGWDGCFSCITGEADDSANYEIY